MVTLNRVFAPFFPEEMDVGGVIFVVVVAVVVFRWVTFEGATIIHVDTSSSSSSSSSVAKDVLFLEEGRKPGDPCCRKVGRVICREDGRPK